MTTAITPFRHEVVVDLGGPPVEIDVRSAADGRDLVDCLWRHGFVGHLTTDGRFWRVGVRSPHESARRLLLDLVQPLELWLRDHPRPELVVRLLERPA
jgi:hypothetical protein